MVSSIEEFLDGMPIFDEINFSNFRVNSNRKIKTYISTAEYTESDVIVNEKPERMFKYIHPRWDSEHTGTKRKRNGHLAENEMSGPSTSKRSLIED